MRAFVFSTIVFIGTGGAVTELSAQGTNAAPPDPAAVRASNARFAGIWQLVGEEARDAAGRTIPGPNDASGGRVGYIVYDTAGYMGVTLSWPVRAKFAGAQPTADEARLAMRTYNSYWGSFAVNEADGIVTHQTFGALSPSFSGTDQQRGFTISDNRLTLRPPTAANGDQRALIWERVPDLPTLTPTHRKLIGFWKLILREQRDAEGALLSSSPGQTGFIVYTASGHVMVHMMQPYRRRNVGASPTAAETMATYESYNSYFGTYTVHESESEPYLVHHLVGVLNPNFVGTEFKRYFELAENRLVLKPPATSRNDGRTVQTTITWERLSD